MCLWCELFFFFKQKTAYEMRISDWSSDVCSSDLEGLVDFLLGQAHGVIEAAMRRPFRALGDMAAGQHRLVDPAALHDGLALRCSLFGGLFHGLVAPWDGHQKHTGSGASPAAARRASADVSPDTGFFRPIRPRRRLRAALAKPEESWV